MRLHFWAANKQSEAINTSISEAKKMLKKDGGIAWTEHYERDGGLFEITPIELSKNNSKHKYSRHL